MLNKSNPRDLGEIVFESNVIKRIYYKMGGYTMAYMMMSR